MDHNERVALIRDGVPRAGETWADFGAGSGAFTTALRALVGPQVTLYAIDRDARALRRQTADVHTIKADITGPIQNLPPLDGLLVANALHFIPVQHQTIRTIAAHLKPGGTFLIVEYDVARPRSYIPHPLGQQHCLHLLTEAGLQQPETIGIRRSPSSGITMYAARANAPTRHD